MDIRLKKITSIDYPVLIELIKEFSVFEKSMGAVTNSVERMLVESDHINGYLAIVDGDPVGYATYFFPYHTWVGKCIHMDDLFVKESYRRHGIGKELLNAVIEVGKEENCNRIRWQVSDWNSEAQEFYKNAGASIKNSEFDCEIIF